MVFISYFYVGIDDTDSPDGMCTTFLVSRILCKLRDCGVGIVGFPRLVRLNPFVRHKTRGNGAVSFKVSLDEDLDLVREVVLREVGLWSRFDCVDTNPGVVFYGGVVSDEMVEYSFRALYEFISIGEAEEFAERVGAEFYKFKKGRGIIGSLAAIGLPLEDFTYELLVYRDSENYGSLRRIDVGSVFEMDEVTFPGTFENVDYEEGYVAIAPRTPCPVLYGVRGEDVGSLSVALGMVRVDEPIFDFCVFKTNQHTDMHIRDVGCIGDMERFGCYRFVGCVGVESWVVEGGHMFVELFDFSGSVVCAAYEPTKGFRRFVSLLRVGDVLEVYGGIGESGAFNIEKFRVVKLNRFEFRNPVCVCGKRMSSAGKGKGFKCKRCGRRSVGSKERVVVSRGLVEGSFYEVPVSARRHLSKPVCRLGRG